MSHELPSRLERQMKILQSLEAHKRSKQIVPEPKKPQRLTLSEYAQNVVWPQTQGEQENRMAADCAGVIASSVVGAISGTNGETELFASSFFMLALTTTLGWAHFWGYLKQPPRLYWR